MLLFLVVLNRKSILSFPDSFLFTSMVPLVTWFPLVSFIPAVFDNNIWCMLFYRTLRIHLLIINIGISFNINIYIITFLEVVFGSWAIMHIYIVQNIDVFLSEG